MKIIKYMSLILIVAITFISCENDRGLTKINESNFVVPSSISGFDATVVISKAIKNDSITITFSPADFGPELITNYKLQFDIEENNFSNVKTFDLTSNTPEFEFTIGKFNEFLQEEVGLSVDNQHSVNARIIAYVHEEIDTLISEPVKFNITPYLDILFAENTLYLFGDGVGKPAQNNKLNLIPVHSHPNLHWRIMWLEASGSFKFCADPNFQQVFGKTGDLAGDEYDKGTEDIPVPGTAGYYMIVADLSANKISITQPRVYLIGPTVGVDWDVALEANIFTVDNENEVITITKDLAAEQLRMYVAHHYFSANDWWHSEFMIFSDEMAFRGVGNDQDRINISGGSTTVELNFKTGAASIKSN